jgi:hypothetical protein
MKGILLEPEADDFASGMKIEDVRQTDIYIYTKHNIYIKGMIVFYII